MTCDDVSGVFFFRDCGGGGVVVCFVVGVIVEQHEVKAKRKARSESYAATAKPSPEKW
jgi:hypothetical protein